MKRYYFEASIKKFLQTSESEIIGQLALSSEFSDELTQKDAWKQQISILKDVLHNFEGQILFEYSIPRMGRRIDVLLIIEHVVFILEFKVGQTQFLLSHIDQVWDYALDLKYFHEPSANPILAPILISTDSDLTEYEIKFSLRNDNVLVPIKCSTKTFAKCLQSVLETTRGNKINALDWINGRYSPSPTIIEAAISLFNNHSVEDISRSDASGEELHQTNETLLEIIRSTKNSSQKAICFLTGVPGSGKTLVGLDIATKQMEEAKTESSVFLSGNGPLVAILRESLTRDKYKKEKEAGIKVKKGEILRSVKTFIQNVHHFRDEAIQDSQRPPADHVAIFDEAQRAWDLAQTASFMSRKKKIQDFSHSEPEFLISYLNRHNDWAVIICLVGGGQEINVGEAGISEWLHALKSSFSHWNIYISNELADSEYAAKGAIENLKTTNRVHAVSNLHLSVTMRSFRAENLSTLIKNILDLNAAEAMQDFTALKLNYPIVITRELAKGKTWVKSMARGNERYGIVVSSKASRLKPHAIDVTSPMDPVKWFLNEKDDTRSSYYLEQVATEFDVQGLELDWVCVTWDGDFRYKDDHWGSFEFKGNKWQTIKKEERKKYLKNAYRVLLTRARQGMVIVIPHGDENDQTRDPKFYDSTFKYLSSIGFPEI